MKQVYDKYTQEDREVWKLLYNRQLERFPDSASEAHLSGMDIIGFSADEIPSFDAINDVLRKQTGWSLVVVPGIVPDYTFFELMANRRFPATTWLRKMKELDYLEEPDMFHDVFAHVPLLTNQAFVDFLEAISKIGLVYSGNEAAIYELSKLYWYTVEFGLIKESAGLRIYGAGILSSAGETDYSLSAVPHKHGFDVQQIMASDYRKDVFQTQYFVIDDYAQLYDSISEIEEQMARYSSQVTA